MSASFVTIRPMAEADLPQADKVFRLAFGTYMGFKPPESFGGDSDAIATRWRANPDQTFVAVVGDEVVGSVFVANWGGVGFFGPLTVRPDYWDGGVGKRLLEPVVDLFDRWGTKHAGLFTFPDSPKHMGLYQKFGFWPRFLTMMMSRPTVRTEQVLHTSLFSELPPSDRASTLSECRELAGSILEGLDVNGEVQAVAIQGLGDTVLLRDAGGHRLAGLAVCHIGPGSEAGSGCCYVKFGAVRSGPSAGERFADLLDACEALGAIRGASVLLAGVNSARAEAYRLMLALGFRTERTGVAMHRPDAPGYCRPDVFLIDDWR
jgi:predicted N-acetyltransferase YhbS